MKKSTVKEIQKIVKAYVDSVASQLEQRIAYQVALELAIEERLGRAPRDRDVYFESDEQCAREIVALYPRPEA